MKGKSLSMNNGKYLILLLSTLFISACFNFSFNGSVNNVWKVPDTDLSVAVEKQQSGAASKDVARKMILQENLLDKTKIDLAKGLEIYRRINIYQIGKNEYVLRDIFEIYILNTQIKTLTKTSPEILTQTFEDTKYPKFIGAFDDNENGNWRYIPATARNEIPLTALGSQ